MIARIFRRTWWDAEGLPEAGPKTYVKDLPLEEYEGRDELAARAREECARMVLPDQCLKQNEPTDRNPRGRSWKFEFEIVEDNR